MRVALLFTLFCLLVLTFGCVVCLIGVVFLGWFGVLGGMCLEFLLFVGYLYVGGLLLNA